VAGSFRSARQVCLIAPRPLCAAYASRLHRSEVSNHPTGDWPSENWSGRRGSNPRPTAWKAVTLPLSYSRLRASRRQPCCTTQTVRLATDPTSNRPSPPSRPRLPAEARRRSRERRLVAREGFEPSKALGRQIYSLLRLTASLPRRYLLRQTRRVYLFSPLDCLSGFCAARVSYPSLSQTGCHRQPWFRSLRVSRFSAGNVELAKGFEPPTG
jgi:hypothetical protein